MIIFLHLALALAFFFIINWVGKHSAEAGYKPLSFFAQPDEAPAFNFVFRALSPVVYIILVAAILYSVHLDWLVLNIYLVTVYYAALRLLFNFAQGQLELIDWKVRIPCWVLSILVSWIVYEHIIKTKQHLLPDLDKIADELWIGILFFLYSAFNSIQGSTIPADKRLSQYVSANYEALRRDYDTVIRRKTDDQRIQALIYSIMIYENFNRPKFRRLLENIGFRFGKCKTLGIMQVTTGVLINDLQSVKLGADKIIADDNQARTELKKEAQALREASKDDDFSCTEEPLAEDVTYKTISFYNPDGEYVREVMSIYNKIAAYYPSLRDASSSA